MFQLMTVCPKIVSPQNGSALRLTDNAGIEFAGVSFDYQPGQPIRAGSELVHLAA